MIDEHWFDALHKRLIRITSRKSMLRAAGVSITSLFFGRVASAEAKKNRKKGKEKKGKRKNKDKRTPKPKQCRDGREPCLLSGLTPICCDAGLTCCDGLCVNTFDNDDHCNACNQPCSPGKVCFGGDCVCQNGLELCGEICRDTQRDENFCGGCNTLPCTGDGMRCCDGICSDTSVSWRHCGACDHECTGPGARCCDSGCVDERFDDRHCGALCLNCTRYNEKCCHGRCYDPDVSTCCRTHTSGPVACTLPESCCTNADGQPDCC